MPGLQLFKDFFQRLLQKLRLQQKGTGYRLVEKRGQAAQLLRIPAGPDLRLSWVYPGFKLGLSWV